MIDAGEMIECPTPDRLRQMLEATLPNLEQTAIEDHVNTCSSCQQALEQLTAAPHAAKHSTIDPAADTFLARVQALLPGVGAGPPSVPGPVPTPDVPGY